MQAYEVLYKLDRKSFRVFEKEFQSGNIANFIERFNKDNNCNLPPEIVISLGLYEAVKKGKEKLVDKILPTSSNVAILLTTVNGEQFSPLTYALTFNKKLPKSGILEIIENCIAKLPATSKVDLVGEDFMNLHRLALVSHFEDYSIADNIKYFTKHYFSVYTPRSLEDFKSSFEKGYNYEKHFKESVSINYNSFDQGIYS